MSVRHGRRLGKARRRSGRRPVGISAWSLWAAPRPFLAYVVVIDIAAVALVALTLTVAPVGGRDLARFGVLVTGSVLHLEITRRLEALRELHAEGRAYVNLVSVWTLPAMLILPPPLIAAFLAVVYGHMWYRIGHRATPHRWIFSAGNMVVSSAAGVAVLAVTAPQTYPLLPRGVLGVALFVGAATAVRWAVNRTLSGVAFLLMRPGTTWGQAFGFGTNDLIECGALSLGVLAAFALADELPLAVWVMAAVLTIHPAMMSHEFSTARRDRATGLYRAEFWHDTLAKAVDRAEAYKSRVGVLLVHLDDLADVVRDNGVDAGNHLLRRAAEVLTGHVRRKDDLLGRLPADDIGMVLSDVTQAELLDVAERIRAAMRTLSVELGKDATIDAGTVSIGGAIYPDHADNASALLLKADASMIAAQVHLGDQTRIARSRGS